MDKQVAEFVVTLLLGILLRFVIALGIERNFSEINLDKVVDMLLKCSTNDGVDNIKSNYDVTCSNGAIFSYKEGK